MDEAATGDNRKTMRKYSNNWVFIDLLFNLLVGFTSLFIIAFMLINPIAKKAVVDPPIMMMIESRWNKHSDRDIDLYVQGPNGTVVYYSNRDGGYMVLERDDLGKRNDTYVINGEEQTVQRNYEIVTLSQLPKGEYTVNINYFNSQGDAEEVEVVVTQLMPFKVVAQREISLTPRQESTVVNFLVDNTGAVVDIRTDLDIPLRKSRGAP